MSDHRTYDLFQPTEEHRLLREMVRSFVRTEVEAQAHDFNKREAFNLPLFKKLGSLGLLGITVPEVHGGSGMDALAACIAHEELSYADPGFALAYLAHAMLCVNNIAVNANENQKKKYLPGLSSGALVGAMAISEPNVGTDVMRMETMACKDGSNYRLNGRKMWITNGCVDDQGTPADVVWVYARTDNGGPGVRPELSTFIVEKGQKGFSVGQKILDKTGMRSSNTAELVFDNCLVPKENLVGQEGESLMHMMRNLEIERVTLAAMSLGMAMRSVEVMNRYAGERQAFGEALHQFGQIQRYIADSYAEYMAARCYVYETARRMDLTKEGDRLNSDGVKLVAATMAKNVADRAMQVLGGYGYVGEYVVERLWRDAKLIEIGGGTIEAHQKNMTRDLSKRVGALF